MVREILLENQLSNDLSPYQSCSETSGFFQYVKSYLKHHEQIYPEAAPEGYSERKFKESF